MAARTALSRLADAVRRTLKQRDLSFLLGSQFAAQAADGLAQAVIFDALVLDPLEQDTPGRILAVAALTLLPYSLLSPFLGVLVDRWSRRKLLTGTNYVRGVALLVFPIWSRALPEESALYVAALFLLGVGRLFLTTKGAALPVVLGETRLLGGNAASSGGGMIAALGGAAVGALVTGLIETTGGLVVAGFAYVAAGFIAGRISGPLSQMQTEVPRLRDAIVQVGRDLMSGLRELGRRPRAVLPLISIFLLRIVGMIVVFAAILAIKSEFPTETDRFGRLASAAGAVIAAGAGAFIGVVSAPLVGARLSKPKLVLLGYLVSGVAIGILGGIVDVRAVLLLTFVGGYGAFITKIAVDAQVQEALPDDYRGRAFALYDILYNVASVLAGVVIVTTQQVSLRAVLIVVGFITLAMAAGLWSSMRRFGMLDEPAGASHPTR